MADQRRLIPFAGAEPRRAARRPEPAPVRQATIEDLLIGEIVSINQELAVLTQHREELLAELAGVRSTENGCSNG
jgi:hypothetical protein